MPDQQHHPEIIESRDVITRDAVTRVESRGEIMKIKASIAVAVISLLVALAVLAMGAWTGNSELQTWATGLISAVAGAAISYGFNR